MRWHPLLFQVKCGQYHRIIFCCNIVQYIIFKAAAWYYTIFCAVSQSLSKQSCHRHLILRRGSMSKYVTLLFGLPCYAVFCKGGDGTPSRSRRRICRPIPFCYSILRYISCYDVVIYNFLFHKGGDDIHISRSHCITLHSTFCLYYKGGGGIPFFPENAANAILL